MNLLDSRGRAHFYPNPLCIFFTPKDYNQSPDNYWMPTLTLSKILIWSRYSVLKAFLVQNEDSLYNDTLKVQTHIVEAK